MIGKKTIILIVGLDSKHHDCCLERKPCYCLVAKKTTLIIVIKGRMNLDETTNMLADCLFDEKLGTCYGSRKIN